MYPQWSYIPYRMMPPRTFMRTNINPIMENNIFKKMGMSLHSINWNKILTGANKTLNVVNQTIPLIRQTGPMINNMKSLVRIAKSFRKETNSKKDDSVSIKNDMVKDDISSKENMQKANKPIFFI